LQRRCVIKSAHITVLVGKNERAPLRAREAVQQTHDCFAAANDRVLISRTNRGQCAFDAGHAGVRATSTETVHQKPGKTHRPAAFASANNGTLV
jgi:hypothetical protein